MNLDDVKKIKIPRQKKHRVGRGPGSGWGTTAGRGNKGAGQRSGTRFRLQFEGGQMPLYRRLPKKGFTNARFKVDMHVVNVGDLDAAFSAGDKVDLEALKRVGLAPKRARYLKVLGFGDLTKALTIVANGVSKGAQEKIDAAKGSIEVQPTQTEMRPKGIKKGGAAAPAAPAVVATPAEDASSSDTNPNDSNSNDTEGQD